MRNSATGEFELRGPFPQREYARIMDSTNAMLAAFHAMNVIIAKDLNASAGETALLRYTATERAQLSSRISHLFQVLASSLKLEYPINDALPNTVSSRDRLLARIYQFRQDEVRRASEDIEGGEVGERGRELAEDRDYELLYAYALVTGQLSAEIQKVEREIEGLFGVLDEEMLRLT
jgi:ABC-type phosphate transport system auxiliary subunit